MPTPANFPTKNYRTILSPQEARIAKWIGTQREINALEQGAENKDKICGRGGIENHVLGFQGEFAFCKMVNLFPDFTPVVRKGGYDFMTVNGIPGDVKTTDHPNGDLMFVSMKCEENKDYEIFVFMVKSGDEYTYRGWIERDEVFIDRFLTDIGKGPCYCVHMDYLRG
jgi:hypothetical protein